MTGDFNHHITIACDTDEQVSIWCECDWSKQLGHRVEPWLLLRAIADHYEAAVKT